MAKLLKPGGWILLDDVKFFLRSMPNWQDLFANKSNRELDACQVGMIYDLVVRQHPDFCDFFISLGGRFGWPRKKVRSALPGAGDSPVQSQYDLLERENQLLREHLEAIRRGRVMRLMNRVHKCWEIGAWPKEHHESSKDLLCFTNTGLTCSPTVVQRSAFYGH